MTNTPVRKNPSFFQSLVCLLGVLLLVFTGLMILKISLHSIMLFCILWVGLNAYFLGHNFTSIRVGMNLAVQRCTPVFSIFLLIGVIIAAFVMSGTIPSLIYYGLSFIHPHFFLPIGLILCSLMSLSTGTAFGTAGTMGIALLGIGSSLGYPMPMIAGMVVSGAFFGDKLSSASDTTILSAMSTETELYRHIRNMTPTLIPSYILTLLCFFFIGLHTAKHNASFDLSQQHTVQQLLFTHFHISPVTLLPLAVMILLSFKKIPAEIAMMSSVLMALVMTMWLQHMPLSSFLTGLFQGPEHILTPSPILDRILKSGGMMSMMWSLSLTILVLSLGGILEYFGFLHVLLCALTQSIKRYGSLILTTIVSCLLCNLLMGEAYLSIILIGKSFQEKYDELNLDRCMLSRSIEEGATFSTALIPWTTAGAFMSSTLGVKTADYFCWSFLNWIEPLVAIAFAYAGFAIVKKQARI
jgi:NhaC family Na+:H+ antiporter